MTATEPNSGVPPARRRLATDPPVSEAQRRAMWAAAKGRSTLGISKKVGKEFVGADMRPRDWLNLLSGFFKFITEEAGEPEHSEDSDEPKGRAASLLLTTPGGEVLLVKRSDSEENFPGHWAFPGGKVDDGEDEEKAARREAMEEVGHDAGTLSEFDKNRTARGWDHTTFLSRVPEPFEPTLNEEHSEHRWSRLDDLPSPLHPGVAETLDKLRSGGFAGDAALAFDRESVRRDDKDGRLHVDATNISKANVCEYRGKEIPDFEALGLDAERRYRLYRDPAELRRGAPTFNNVPLLSEHVPVTAEEHKRELVIGSTGTDATFEDPYLRNSLVVWPQEAIDLIEGDEAKELSCAYHYRADMRPGSTPAGEPYDGVMRDIVGNHVALVKKGRAGPDVVVGDSAIEDEPTTKEADMAKVMTAAAQVAKGALIAYLRPKLATDAKIDLVPILGGLTKKGFAAAKPKIAADVKLAARGKLAKDAALEDITDMLDVLDPAIGEVEDEEPKREEPKAEDDEPTKFLKGKMSAEDWKAYDEMRVKAAADKAAKDKAAKDEEEKKKKEGEDAEEEKVDKKAMDAAISTAVKTASETATTAALAAGRAIRAAEKHVRPLVGDLAMDAASAEEVYRTVLTARGVKVEGVHPSAFPALVDAQIALAAKPRRDDKLASDEAPSAGFASRYGEHAGRIAVM